MVFLGVIIITLMFVYIRTIVRIEVPELNGQGWSLSDLKKYNERVYRKVKTIVLCGAVLIVICFLWTIVDRLI